MEFFTLGSKHAPRKDEPDALVKVAARKAKEAEASSSMTSGDANDKDDLVWPDDDGDG